MGWGPVSDLQPGGAEGTGCTCVWRPEPGQPCGRAGGLWAWFCSRRSGAGGATWHTGRAQRRPGDLGSLVVPPPSRAWAGPAVDPKPGHAGLAWPRPLAEGWALGLEVLGPQQDCPGLPANQQGTPACARCGQGGHWDQALLPSGEAGHPGPWPCVTLAVTRLCALGDAKW